MFRVAASDCWPIAIAYAHTPAQRFADEPIGQQRQEVISPRHFLPASEHWAFQLRGRRRPGFSASLRGAAANGAEDWLRDLFRHARRRARRIARMAAAARRLAGRLAGHYTLG